MKLHSLYGGRITIGFNEREHCYTYEEKRCQDGSALKIAGVTSILKRLDKPALLPWASNMAADYFLSALTNGYDVSNPDEILTWTVAEANQIAKDARKAYARKTKGAADVGKLVHAYAEAFLKGDKSPAPPKKKLTPQEQAQYNNGVAAFQAWWKANDVELIASERVLFSERWMFAGTTDLTARVNGRKGVFDIKTSSGLYYDMALQIAAYRIALEEEEKEVYPWGALVHLDKNTGNYAMKWIPRNKEHEDAFLGLREADEILKRMEKNW